MEAALDLSLRLATAAHGRDDPAEAAADVLAELCAREPVAAATLTCYDPITDSHRALCSTGYTSNVLDFLRSPAFLSDDVGYRLLVDHPGKRARCWRDVHVDYTQTRSVVQVFRPAGFAGGATARLTTRTGSYAGDLHMSTTDADLPTPTLMLALHHAAPLLAAAVDVTRRLRLGLVDLGPDEHAAVVTDRGTVVPLSGTPNRTGDPDLPRRVARWRRAGHLQRDGWYRHRWRGRWWRVRLSRVERGTLLVTAPDASARGLTVRELEVLTLLTDGLPNVAIAHRLDISERTAAHHVEHILDKLGAKGRTSAARLALEDGLRLLP
ncbi:helix-turn-helix transcriptional regulator [Pseudonocardia acaciae]|uniref:helix-turn-helix transcriptional regulator n=1 Tax=Pseudonocardia acaciae TaxID=551276 RepID=UPI000491BB08|nr:LuxR C-terminal-related transcriptional regulator [Pseudonocardia acaciae]